MSHAPIRPAAAILTVAVLLSACGQRNEEVVITEPVPVVVEEPVLTKF